MAKALFLDIDGVLNSNFWNDSHQREISDGTLVDEERIKILASLVKRTNAKIILHSGWRFWFDDELKPLGTEAEKELITTFLLLQPRHELSSPLILQVE